MALENNQSLIGRVFPAFWLLTQVDIDIKLRSCKGSCERYSEYQVDQESYVALDKQVCREADRPPYHPHHQALTFILTFSHPLGSQVNQLDSQSTQSIVTTGALFVMKSKPLRGAVVETIYKSGATQPLVGQQSEDMFPEVSLFNLYLCCGLFDFKVLHYF